MADNSVSGAAVSRFWRVPAGHRPCSRNASTPSNRGILLRIGLPQVQFEQLMKMLKAYCRDAQVGQNRLRLSQPLRFATTLPMLQRDLECSSM